MLQYKFIILCVLLLLEIPMLYVSIYVIYMIYSEFIQNKKTETFETTYNKGNLFMNKIPYDDITKRDIIKVKQYVDENQETLMKTLFYEDIFRPLTDYFEKKTSYRQFYTTPDVSGHIDCVYRDMKSCKEDPTICFPYRDRN